MQHETNQRQQTQSQQQFFIDGTVETGEQAFPSSWFNSSVAAATANADATSRS
jgi:hypothetical protein